VLPALGLEVHERRLRERHERAGGWMSAAKAARSTQNEEALTATMSPPAKAKPPPRTRTRRRQVTATTPSTGSTASETMLGTA
jgi:hypothetical protein